MVSGQCDSNISPSDFGDLATDVAIEFTCIICMEGALKTVLCVLPLAPKVPIGLNEFLLNFTLKSIGISLASGTW